MAARSAVKRGVHDVVGGASPLFDLSSEVMQATLWKPDLPFLRV